MGATGDHEEPTNLFEILSPIPYFVTYKIHSEPSFFSINYISSKVLTSSGTDTPPLTFQGNPLSLETTISLLYYGAPFSKQKPAISILRSTTLMVLTLSLHIGNSERAPQLGSSNSGLSAFNAHYSAAVPSSIKTDCTDYNSSSLCQKIPKVFPSDQSIIFGSYALTVSRTGSGSIT